MEWITQALASFTAGLLSSVSPCVYPTLPITIGFLTKQASESKRKKWPILLYAIGQSLALWLIGLAAVGLGEIFGFSSQNPWVHFGVAVVLFFSALLSFKGRLPSFLSSYNSLFSRWGEGSSYISAFLLGASSALIASPCTTPILGGILALMANTHSFFKGSFFMLLYAVGFSLLFVILGLGFIKAIPKSGPWLNTIHHIASFLLLLLSFYFTYQGILLLEGG